MIEVKRIVELWSKAIKDGFAEDQPEILAFARLIEQEVIKEQARGRAEYAYQLERKGDVFLTRDEREWIEERRKRRK